MTTFAENEQITRVEGDAPLGRMLRENYWMPFARSEALVPGGGPMRVRLLGTDMVAFRGEDGTLGLVDERCPHRLASMALARVEGCTLRCIYHGWVMDATGAVIDVPSEGERSALFASRVKTKRYHIQEGGGLVWAFLGVGEPPALPPLPFMTVAPRCRWWSRMMVKCNWLQGFEGAIDSVHLNFLHSGTGSQKLKDNPLSVKIPRYEIEEMDYGLRTAAIRDVDANKVHFRVAEFIAPFYAFSASRQPSVKTDNSAFISVPVDDTTHMLFFGFWDEGDTLADVEGYFSPELDRDDLTGSEQSRTNSWSQDRAAMAAGHFSGIQTSVLHEDLAVQESMGPIVDRSQEQLAGTDLAIVRMREFMLRLIRRHEGGLPVDRELQAYRASGCLPFSYEASRGADWRIGGARKQKAA